MNDLLKRFIVEEEGQGITEYALILGLVVFGIWLAIGQTNIGEAITNLFSDVAGIVSACTSGASSGPCSN